MFPRTWWIHSNIVLEVGFPELIFLGFIPYSLSISVLLKSLSINSDPFLCVIYIGPLILNKFTINISRLSLYCVSLIALGFKVISLNFYDTLGFKIFIWYIRYTNSLFRAISSVALAGNLPYLTFCTLVIINIINFLLDGVSDVVPVKMLTNHRFCSIQYCNTDICIILVNIRNFGVLTKYRFYIHTLWG